MNSLNDFITPTLRFAVVNAPVVLALCFAFAIPGRTQSKDPLYTKLCEHIYAINNQYYYNEKVHVYLIELENAVLLFDIPTYSHEVENFMRSFKKPVLALLSHGSCGIEDGNLWQKKLNVKIYLHADDSDHPWLRLKPDVLFSTPPRFDKDIDVIHTPGHSKGSVCLLDKRTRSLFTGDTFQPTRDGVIKDFMLEEEETYENNKQRLESCKKLLQLDFENVMPFHYSISLKNGKTMLNTFLQRKEGYLNSR